MPLGTHVDDLIQSLGTPDWEAAVTDADLKHGFCPLGSVKVIGYRERPLLPTACKEVTNFCLDGEGRIVDVSNVLVFGSFWH